MNEVTPSDNVVPTNPTEDTTMSDQVTPTNPSDDPVVDDSTDMSTANAAGNGIRAGSHDQNTIFQQNNSAVNELIQSIVETRRETVSLFEQRMRQQDVLFNNQIQQQQQMFQQQFVLLAQNADAKNAREASNQQQAQVQNASQANTDATFANSQALASTATFVKLSDGIYLP